MKNQLLRVLMVEDLKDDALLIIRELKKGGYNPGYERVETAAAMKKALNDKQWDIILCDYSLPEFNGPSAISLLKETNLDIPLIMVTATIGEETAVECMRLGAQDFIIKGNLSRLCPAIARELADAEVRNKKKQMEEELWNKEVRFRAFLEHSSDIIVILNREGIITYINPAIEKVLGFKPEERIGSGGFDLIHPDDMQISANSFNTLANDTNSPVIRAEIRLCHKDGSWRTIEAVGSNFVLNNVVESIIVNYRDITERKRMYDELYLSKERFRLLSDATFEAIVIHEDGVPFHANDNFFKIFGYKPDEMLGKEMLSATIAPESLDFVKKRAATNNLKPYEAIGVRKDGTKFPMEIRARKIEYEGRTFRCGAIRDITERKRADEELKESERRYRDLSIMDDLTQLYNSRHFYTQLEKEIERCRRYEQPFTLLLLDIDKFKNFNDKYGHLEGNYILSELGKIIKRCLRETDSAYRYGGDEFMIMLPVTTCDDGILTAKRIKEELKKRPFPRSFGQNIYVTVSMGLAQYKANEEMNAFVHRADKLMYQAKKAGRDKICSGKNRQ
ncbi:MAG TPA: diguanylate cyclase [Smithella sp.]|nr:diguanylate cyclase [Smithella sp.]